MCKPDVILPVWIGVGFIIGIGMDNIGAGVAIGVAIGVALYSSKKKTDKESSLDEKEAQISKDSK